VHTHLLLLSAHDPCVPQVTPVQLEGGVQVKPLGCALVLPPSESTDEIELKEEEEVVEELVAGMMHWPAALQLWPEGHSTTLELSDALGHSVSNQVQLAPQLEPVGLVTG
jgi:hypothetical protein